MLEILLAGESLGEVSDSSRTRCLKRGELLVSEKISG